MLCPRTPYEPGQRMMARIDRLINILLRSYGTQKRHGFDHESLEIYSEGRFRVCKLTSDSDQKSIFVITQDQRDVYVSGDAFNSKYISGDWESWLRARTIG